MEKTLTLKIVTPDGTAAEYPCTSLRLPVKDTPDGRGGGSSELLQGSAAASKEEIEKFFKENF